MIRYKVFFFFFKWDLHEENDVGINVQKKVI